MSIWLQPTSRFSEEQLEAYNQIKEGIASNNNYSAIIKGPAGTGKTLILAQLALNIKGKRGILFIYTNALRNFIRNALKQTGDQFTLMETAVETFHTWLFAVYREYTGNNPPHGNMDFNERADEMIDELMDVVQPDIFDYFLIDEGQDFSPKVIRFLNKVAKNLVFVGDANQSLYEAHEDDLGDLMRIINPQDEYSLSLSIRISPSILRFMRRYVMNIYDNLRNVRRDEDQDSRPLVYKNIDRDAFLSYFINNVAMNYLQSDKNLVITCHHNDDVDAVYAKIISLLPNNNNKVVRVSTKRGQNISFSESNIYCITMHSCKGLEFDNLLYMNINNEPKFGIRQHNNLSYTSFTRARNDLIIYSPDDQLPLKDFLDFDFATVIDELPDANETIEVDVEELI